jgi:hypothetical protein
LSYPGNGFVTVSRSLQITHDFFHSPITFFFIILHLPIPNTRLNSIPLLPSSYPGRLVSQNSTQFFSTELKVKVKVTLRLTVSQSVSLGVEPQPDIYYSSTVTVLFLWGALSDERTGLSFIYAAGPRQHSLSRVRVPCFTISDLRLPLASPPTPRRDTVEVFDPASTRSLTISVRVTLRLTVSQSVCLGIEPLRGLMTRY